MAFSRAYELFGLEIDTAWGLARADEVDGDDDGAAARMRELISRCLAREERHYSVAALRWAASFFGLRSLRSDLGAATDALARTSAATGTAEATAALAHALGESALLDGDARRAADQFEAAKGGTALDVVRNMPSVTVNGQGEISLRGSGGFAVFLNGMVSVVGVMGGYTFNVIMQGGTPGAYMASFNALAQLPDLWISELKALIFGFLAGVVAAFRGLNPPPGPKGVGDAVNQSVVITFLLLFAVNFILTTLYLQLVPPKGM